MPGSRTRTGCPPPASRRSRRSAESADLVVLGLPIASMRAGEPGLANMIATLRLTLHVFAIAVLAAANLAASAAHAAGTAYGVDTAEVSEIGNCKVESWLSWASNQDFIGVSNPSCVVDLGR